MRTNVLLARTLVRYLGADYTHKYTYFVAALVDLVGCPVDALQRCFGDDIRATLKSIIRILSTGQGISWYRWATSSANQTLKAMGILDLG